MAYTTIPKRDEESNLVSGSAHSPIPHGRSQTSLSTSFEDLVNGIIDHPTLRNNNTDSRATALLRSFTTSSRSRHSYELVEDDDYEQPQMTPTFPRDQTVDNTVSRLENGRPVQEYETQDTPVRTASISRHLPLNHPTPDLQSMQGAYLKNVERLEESAERLSIASSLEEELHRMKREQRSESVGRRSGSGDGPREFRQFSSTSLSNSIIGVNHTARSGGYSPGGHITSPVESVRSGHWGQNSVNERKPSKSSRLGHAVAESDFNVRFPDFGEVSESPMYETSREQLPISSRSLGSNSNPDRPPTSASHDTYQQSQNLFFDFDGTHYSPALDDPRVSRRISTATAGLALATERDRDPRPSHRMSYYPAPVPVMLNLPTRLSKANWSERDKLKMQALGELPDNLRRSAAWLSNAEVGGERRRPLSNLPPQLRASAYFDQGGTPQDVQLQGGSAVATLDSILDAAAYAPVTAFTDHPYAGHLGDEVYGQAPRKSMQSTAQLQQKRRSSLSHLLGRRKSNATLAIIPRDHEDLDENASQDSDQLEGAVRTNIGPGADELVDEVHREAQDGELPKEKGDAESDDEGGHRPGFLGAPTTLLAELQMRKAQQKLRNRTAADAFPNGMHSTLLELDAVTQLQQKSRKTKHVTLAWEDQDAATKENFDDDEIPLGLLFPEKDRAHHVSINRPLGLMERRELEDNEPLSSRRARLRGEVHDPSKAATPSAGPAHAAEKKPTVDVPGLPDKDLPEQEEETLAQRRQRVKEQQSKGTGFADDIASQLGLSAEEVRAPPQEETLGQRRKRLKEESTKKTGPQPGLKAKVSMADLLRAHPVGHRGGDRQVSGESGYSQTQAREHARALEPQTQVPQAPQYNSAAQLSQYPVQQQPGYGFQFGMMPYTTAGFANGMQMPQIQMPTMNFMNGMGFGYPQMNGMPMSMMYAQNQAMMGPPMTPQQRAGIDRWRQDIA